MSKVRVMIKRCASCGKKFKSKGTLHIFCSCDCVKKMAKKIS